MSRATDERANNADADMLDGTGLLWDGILYLSLTDVCERFSMSRYALRKLRREHGLMKFHRYGDNRRYLRLPDLMAVLSVTAAAVGAGDGT